MWYWLGAGARAEVASGVCQAARQDEEGREGQGQGRQKEVAVLYDKGARYRDVRIDGTDVWSVSKLDDVESVCCVMQTTTSYFKLAFDLAYWEIGLFRSSTLPSPMCVRRLTPQPSRCLHTRS